MKKSALVLMAASVGLLVACSDLNETDFYEKTVDGNLVEQVIFEAPVIRFLEDDIETRASLSQEGNNDIQFSWEATDTVGVYPDKGSQVFFETVDGVGTNVAHFDGGGWALRENSTYSAYYPFVCNMKLDRNAIPVSFTGQEQTGVSNYSGVRFYLASQGTSSSTGSLRFKFLMLNTVFRLKAYDLPAGSYSKLSITTDDPLFVQQGTFGLDDLSIKGKTYSNTLEISLKDFKLTETSTAQNPVLFYLTAAPVDLRGHKVTIQIYSDDGSVYKCEKTPGVSHDAGAWVGWNCVMEDESVKYAKASSITVGGTYLIVDANDQRLFKGATNGSYDNVSIENNVIVDKKGSLAGYEFTVEKSGNNYYLKFNDGKYLVCNYTGNAAGLGYVNSQSGVTYPYALTTGNNGAFFFSTTQSNDANKTGQVLYYKSEENRFKIGGSGSSVGVHLYLKNGVPEPVRQDRGLSFNPNSVSCTLGETPQKPVLSGTYTPTSVTYSSSDSKIATVSANGTVTPVTAGTVTITASVAEDDQYYAGSASYTLRILKAPSQEWVNMGTVNLENQALQNYLNDANNSYSDTYDGANSNSVMSKYALGSTYRKDCPNPVTINWTYSTASSSTVIDIYESEALTNPVWSQNATANSNSAEVYNLIPGRKYYYTVSEGSTVWEKGYFNTTGRRRMIKVSNLEASGHANNCRDLGGLEVNDKGTKKTIKYGYIFRGTNMDMTTDDEDEKNILTSFLNIGMDIDLRYGNANPRDNNGSSNCYRPFSSSVMDYINPGFNSFADLTTDNKVKNVLTAIFETAKKGKASYFHCYIGADRTGYIAFLIEGLLGVSEKDCSIDYELTSFSRAAGYRYRNDVSQSYYYVPRDGLAFLKSKTGDTFQDKVENYVKSIGITQPQIDEFKSIVLE